MPQIVITQGDITTLLVDAIVNPANSSLLGGGGCDGAIHAVAGPELLVECLGLGGCKTGEAKITRGYNLPAKYIIHTVGPVFGQENGKEEELLANCYLNSLALADKHGLKSIAFPAISTGAFRFPKDRAAEIALATVKKYLAENKTSLERIEFVLFEELDYMIYQKLSREIDILA